MKKLGLALSGGGARGLAHIGILKVFEREGIEIKALSGASMGGIIAALYASGYSPDKLETEALRMSSFRNLLGLIDISAPRRGLVTGERIHSYLSQFIDPSLTFNALHIPLAVAAVDLTAGKEIVLSDGAVLDAVMATSAFPGVFPPVNLEGRSLIDGGVLNNLPTDLLRALGADVLVAVDVGPVFERDNPMHVAALFPGFALELYLATQIMASALTRAHLREYAPDLLLNPKLAPDIGIFLSFTRASEIIAAGELAAEEALPAIKTLLS